MNKIFTSVSHIISIVRAARNTCSPFYFMVKYLRGVIMKIYDCHIHSEFSIDGKDSIDEICKTAIEKGATAITITDHALPMPEGVTNYTHIENCVKAAREIAPKYKDKLLVLVGAERDDEYPAEYRERFYDFDLDCVLGSAHSKPTFSNYFAEYGYKDIKDCSVDAPKELLAQVVKKYYHRLTKLAFYADVDVITHLTFLFRYINGYNKRGLEIEPFYPEIDNVLKGVIETGKALEINTSGKALEWNQFMPNAEILKRYHDMGGRIITLGSDAHKKENIAFAFTEAIKMLKDIGFTHGSYFVKRERKEYKL